jgi:hypothetical protein
MTTEDGDDLVQFQDVRVIGSTGSALLCRVGTKSVWLPRGHISGKLWCTGDRGRLFIRRWVARERQLLDPQGATLPPTPLSHLSVPLHLIRAKQEASHGK